MTKFNKPWFHFLVLGAALFLFRVALFPEPKSVVGPLSEARIAALMAQWNVENGQQMMSDQRAGLIAAELDRDMLFQHALEMDLHLEDGIVFQRLIRNMNFLGLADGQSETELFERAIDLRLHLGDEVIKRRLIQRVEEQLLAQSLPPEPTTAEIETAFEQRSDELRHPPRYSFEHVFFPEGQPGAARAAIARIGAQDLGIDAARRLGFPFLLGQSFTLQDPNQLARNFGRDFAQALIQSDPQAEHWVGPVQSIYGTHYIWINAVEPGREASLVEVQSRLITDLQYAARAEALHCAVLALRKDYDVRGLAATELNRGSGESCP
ncbi:peptidyl-prolyl cis-trans isomerase [Erythrobacter sp. Alg231-14]|uniref:peptidyl-prolyl cis-trans isomerase n=1 Tax=Erythrobacter sp. Alg231-14 TaxID=1922225 RepID=UPI000D557253